MSSLVAFPFKSEDIEVFQRSIQVAAAHPRVDGVLCVGHSENDCYRQLAEIIPKIAAETRKRIELIVQKRLGSKRPGKGDGMNTALKFFLETDHERLHFYDSDILSFSAEWITKAEEAADEGYQVVRHYFPRASTDAMVTWMVTKTGFALLWPDTELPFIEQPLGGELLMTREVAEKLFHDERVRARSDWGIDTIYTWAMVKHGFSLYETYIAAGKLHKLYGALSDLKEMVIECFNTIQELQSEWIAPTGMVHRIERPGPVPEAVKEKTAYDLEGSLHLLMEDWTERQLELLEGFPPAVREGMRECRRRPRFKFMDDLTWYETYKVLLKRFDFADEDWRELLFKLWIARVLNYTASVALRGYDYSLYYLQRMIEGYARRARRERIVA